MQIVPTAVQESVSLMQTKKDWESVNVTDVLSKSMTRAQ